eukprot:g79306.t1
MKTESLEKKAKKEESTEEDDEEESEAGEKSEAEEEPEAEEEDDNITNDRYWKVPKHIKKERPMLVSPFPGIQRLWDLVKDKEEDKLPV